MAADNFQPAAPFGAPVRRREDPRLLTGRGRYVSDVELPRLLHVAFVRSTHAHARLRGVDTRTAAYMLAIDRVAYDTRMRGIYA